MITRYDVNGNLAALKSALEETGIFATVDYNDSENPTSVQGKDSDDNILFTVSASSNSWSYTGYKSNGSTIATGGQYASPTYVYKVGTSVAAINCAGAKGTPGALVVLGKTNTGKVGVAISRAFGANSANADITQMLVAAWDDDPAMTTLLSIGSTMEGNSTQIVQLPMHGAYGTPEHIESAYYLPMVQTGMRGLLQEITTDTGETYLTNGYVALLDNGGGET